MHGTPPRRLRVVQIVPDLHAGGAERVALDLALHLDPSRFDVSLLTLYPSTDSSFEREARAARVPLRHLSKRTGPDLRLMLAMWAALREIRPDVAHSHNVLLHNLMPGYVGAAIPARVHTVHNVAEREIPRMLRPVHRLAFRWGGVIPVSISGQVHSSVGLLYPGVRSPIIVNGLDPDRFRSPAEVRFRWRAAHGVSSDALLLVNVGRFMPQKNHAMLLRAFRAILASRPDAVLVLAGTGPLLDATRAQAAALGVDRAVCFLGLRSDVADLLQAADIYVLTSDWEGLPISILEAMAARLPIVGTAVGGVPELVRPGETGRLTSPGDASEFAAAVLELADGAGRRRAFGDRARAIVLEQFTVRTMAQRYGELYQRILAAGRVPRLGARTAQVAP